MVKSELCNFERILPVVLDFADSSAAAIAMDHQRIYNRNKDSMVMQLHTIKWECHSIQCEFALLNHLQKEFCFDDKIRQSIRSVYVYCNTVVL